MKKYFILLTMVFFVSCNGAEKTTNNENEKNIQSSITTNVPKITPKKVDPTIRIQNTRFTPEAVITLDIGYRLDKNGKLLYVQANSQEFDHDKNSEFDEAIQKSVIGLSLQDIESTTIPSIHEDLISMFKEAMKDEY